MKRWIPKTWKVRLKLVIRSLKDYKINFAKSSDRKTNFVFKVGTIQEIKQGNYFENKVHNFKIAKERIERVVVYPNQVFSFWKIIGNPTEKNKFKKGRNIVNGRISEEVGGGLCQISTLIYVTALKSNFEIMERYNHSVDIYSEEDRFTPLGSDATVVYGYKDLRIKNNKSFPICFSFKIDDNCITCTVESEKQIIESELNFIRYENQVQKRIKVVTIIDNSEKYESNYAIQ